MTLVLSKILQKKYDDIARELTKTKNIDDFLKTAEKLKLPSSNTGGTTKVVSGNAKSGRMVFDRLTEGWVKKEKMVDGKKIWNATSPDGKYSLNFREFSSSDSGERIKATIDVIEKRGGGLKDKKREVKFSISN